jgi:hypothetical protein
MSEADLWNKRRDALLRHIEHVRQNCTLLGERLIEKGEAELGHNLIANGHIHDNSKFHGIEWLYLHGDLMTGDRKAETELAIQQHILSNPHHPEYWGSIHEVPRLFVAEMVCDWSARSSEFGNNLRDWTKDKATKKFNMTVQSKVYREIKEFTDILLDPSFKDTK